MSSCTSLQVNTSNITNLWLLQKHLLKSCPLKTCLETWVVTISWLRCSVIMSKNQVLDSALASKQEVNEYHIRVSTLCILKLTNFPGQQTGDTIRSYNWLQQRKKHGRKGHDRWTCHFPRCSTQHIRDLQVKIQNYTNTAYVPMGVYVCQVFPRDASIFKWKPCSNINYIYLAFNYIYRYVIISPQNCMHHKKN